MQIPEISERALDRFKTLLSVYLDRVDAPQIAPETHYSKGDPWISYGAFLYAHSSAIRGEGIYDLGLEHVQKSHQNLKALLAHPNAKTKAWARYGNSGTPLQELPWQVWEDGTFDEMESKALLPGKAWEWFDIRFCTDEAFGLFPAPNLYMMGRDDLEITAHSDLELELSEAITLIGTGKAVSSEELTDALVGPTGGIDFPPEVRQAREDLLNAIRSGRLKVYGNPSEGLRSLHEPKLTGPNQIIPASAFWKHRKYLLTQNTLNPRGGLNQHEPEFSVLTVQAADIIEFLSVTSQRSSANTSSTAG